MDLRGFSPHIEGNWIGQGISYGPYREGQSPEGNAPSKEELAADLHLLAEHWNLIRMHGAGKVTVQVLEIIHEEKEPLRVMLGAWIIPEKESETRDADAAKVAKKYNQLQVHKAIRQASQ